MVIGQILAHGLVANLTNSITFVLCSICTPSGKEACYYAPKEIICVLRVRAGFEGKRTSQGSSPKLSPSRTQLYIMTDVPVTFSQVECNGDTPPENGQQKITKIMEKASDMDGTPPYCRVESSLGDETKKGSQEKSEKLQENILLHSSMEEKILKGKAFCFSIICLI